MEMRSSTGNSTGTSGPTSISCQDCGNKAKRDCEHHRCRTCCKSRGLPCPTHVKSTWIPVSARRRRHHHHLLPPPPSATVDHHLHHPLPLSLSTSATTLHHLRPGIEEGNYPPEVSSLATFRCIKVSSQDNVVDQYAYQTSINIGGHVFKGILYDQGPTTGGGGGGGSTSTATSDSQHLHHQFEHITVANTDTTTLHHPPLSPQGGVPNLLYTSSYSGSFNNAFLPGMQFFPHPRP